MNNRVVKIILFFCLSAYSLCLLGQTPEIRKSADVVVIRGKSYYLHVVEEGQTLFSICKAYGVEVEAVKQANDKTDAAISIFDVLKIPYTEPYVERDHKYYYHKVGKGETLYSISRRFGVKIKRILKENEQYDKTPLGIGDVVRLPLSEIKEENTRQQEIRSEKEKPLTEPVVAAEEEETSGITGDRAETTDTLYLTGENPVFAEPAEEEKPDFVSDPFVPDNKYVKVALLLPFHAAENRNANPSLPDSLNAGGRQKRQILHKSEQFVYFYEGILLAVDSLRREGYKIDLHVFDTEKNTEKMYRLTEEINTLNPDLIIGPVYGSEYKVIAENIANKNIPLVYPLSSRSESFGHYPNFLQVNPSFQVLAGEMAEWIYSQSDTANVISVSLVEKPEEEQVVTEMTEKKLFTEKIRQIPSVSFYKWDFQEEQEEAFKLILKPERENIILLPSSKEADISKILPMLSAFTDEYRITVVGFPEWQNFTSVDHETFYKLNVKLFAYSYIDYSGEDARGFADTYRRYFYTEPYSLTYKAYDMGLYFIPLAAKFGDRLLEAISFCEREGRFSRFHFKRISAEGGRENYGLFMVHYGSDYRLNITLLGN